MNRTLTARRRTGVAAAATAVALTLTLGACSSSSSDDAAQPAADETASAETAGLNLEAAKAIALAAVGEGTVTDHADEDDHGAAWEIEVTRENGDEIDVYVAADGRVVHREDRGTTTVEEPAVEQPVEEAPAAEVVPEPAPEPVAPAAPEAAAPAPAPAAPEASGVVSRAQAESIALRWVGSGRVTWVEREDDHGAAWEIEVTRPNGSEIDVYVSADGRVLNR